MISVESFFRCLRENGIDHFNGVPDSLLKYICAYIADNTPKENHTITVNEGSAVGLATGQYLGSGKPSLVYLQNSGLGNIINPIVSLADSDIYGIPMILLVGWRGEPNITDEPQHSKQGAITIDLLDCCDIPTSIIGPESRDFAEVIRSSIELATKKTGPVALVIKKNTFSKYESSNNSLDCSELSREAAIETIVDISKLDDIFVCSTGMASRELFEIRAKRGGPFNTDFLTVGAMGQANMIALGLAKTTKRKIFCIDGDGACLMHMGNITSLGQSNAKNLFHVVLNNGAHDSVGGQPTLGSIIDFIGLAESCGYNTVFSTADSQRLKEWIININAQEGPHFIEVKIRKGSRASLGRPTNSPNENRISLMSQLGSRNEPSI